MSGTYNEKLLEWIRAPKNFLIVLGNVGCGKTYFCSALLAYFLNKITSEARGFTEKKLFSLLRDNNKANYSTTLENLIDNEVVIFDDFGSTGHSDWRNEIIMDLVDSRYERNGTTVITSNLTKEDIKNTYGLRISSRLFAKENLILDLSDIADFRQQGL